MYASFHWGPEGFKKARFEAYAKLLRLRNGGQVEEATNSFDFLRNEPEDYQDSRDDAELTRANLDTASSSFRDKRLKIAFLDRLSELVANIKGSHHVCAAMMIERPDHVDILVARNNGIKPEDPTLTLLEALSSNMTEIARRGFQGPFSDPAQKIWILLLKLYKPR
ncbi:hypothetical protein B0T14DRAFT_224675 [Immersiella caudata]|uniref:Uncharacterized protein n=1 Tax=Immersiella caudata TaxID=314043 RepID=A0AA40C0B4_9PEZI|nr:hypothetical protein B0T14DRAFT_224675 [Immersiella caudata]